MPLERPQAVAPPPGPPAVKTLLLSLTFASAAVQVAADEASVPVGMADRAGEVIRERDATGRVRVQRAVRLNQRGDYVNHGAWRAWDEAGELVGQGRYAWGKPTGGWSRWATREQSSLLSTEPFVEFEGPFLSQATYRSGEPHGAWSIFDGEGRLVSEVNFHEGLRHGEATLWTASGEVYRRSRFENGLPHGSLEQLSDEGRLETIAEFEQGRRRIERVERHDNGLLKAREQWLGPLTEVATPDDPWRVRLARHEARGESIRDGSRESWWPSGQRKLQATYRQGRAVGEARWWHANGQLALRGGYGEGLAEGDWSWWRETGVRAASCRYVAGEPVGEWSLWAADGRRVDPKTLTPVAMERFVALPTEPTRR